jgi:sulfonate transport system substrate-binding protein
MRRFIAAALASLIAAGAMAGAALAEPKKPDTIRFAYQASHILFVVANELGWFRDEFARDGITFDARIFIAGPPIIEAFAGGRIDFGLVGDQPALLARANNIDVKAVGVPIAGGRSLALLVPAGVPVPAIADLKGKKVAVTVGSVGQHFLFLLLKQAGLKPSDIQQVNLLPPDIKLALEQKNVDAAVTWDPWVATVELDGTATRVTDGVGIKNNANAILVSGPFARDYPELVDRILKVLIRAGTFIRENPDQAAALAAKGTGYRQDIIARTIPNFDYDIRLTDTVVASYEQTAAFLREGGVLRKDVSVKDLVDTSFLKRIGAQ